MFMALITATAANRVSGIPQFVSTISRLPNRSPSDIRNNPPHDVIKIAAKICAHNLANGDMPRRSSNTPTIASKVMPPNNATW
ncbi:hypothetical protein D9M68_794460 [compost metagenome]